MVLCEDCEHNCHRDCDPTKNEEMEWCSQGRPEYDCVPPDMEHSCPKFKPITITYKKFPIPVTGVPSTLEEMEEDQKLDLARHILTEKEEE